MIAGLTRSRPRAHTGAHNARAHTQALTRTNDGLSFGQASGYDFLTH